MLYSISYQYRWNRLTFKCNLDASWLPIWWCCHLRRFLFVNWDKCVERFLSIHLVKFPPEGISLLPTHLVRRCLQFPLLERQLPPVLCVLRVNTYPLKSKKPFIVLLRPPSKLWRRLLSIWQDLLSLFKFVAFFGPLYLFRLVSCQQSIQFSNQQWINTLILCGNCESLLLCRLEFLSKFLLLLRLCACFTIFPILCEMKKLSGVTYISPVSWKRPLCVCIFASACCLLTVFGCVIGHSTSFFSLPKPDLVENQFNTSYTCSQFQSYWLWMLACCSQL